MAHLVEKVMDSYNDIFINQRDPRVDGWLFMDSPWPTFFLCISYVLLVKVIGPRCMKDRPPFDLRRLLVFYNAAQVVFSTWLFYEMAHASWWYYFSKFTEFLDTIFFVLHKKNEHISMLHVIHHGCMPMSVWFGVKFTAGGHSTFFGLVNTFVHIVMYVYYMMAAMGPKYRRYIWWKKYLTNFQMIQFILIFSHAFQLCFTECHYPRAFMWWIGGHAVMFFFLFSEFYIKAYLRGSAKLYMNGTSISSKANGHTNGHIKHANGHANGKANGVANGYSNGHANGHANGTIHYRGSSTKETNGHIPQTEDTSINARVRRLVCMSVDTSLE
ncbi:elongation of very long chain fatty acids protein AAEL008004-like isoform X4 [Portunus trituberculatus]|uniref:elongation of very long chain fatty acids protein AAEL008004-like isoform X4 n=1 Tax=Portunus trituberculatus TaxID=210409 RepID=UPI001E1CCFD1|nr:elongation of very long chain fatty acids protein AAEL008004-like isoform X4 [Portunus trituberculatus]